MLPSRGRALRFARARQLSTAADHGKFVPPAILERAEFVRRRRAAAPAEHDDCFPATPLLRTEELRECARNIHTVTGVPGDIVELFYRTTPIMGFDWIQFDWDPTSQSGTPLWQREQWEKAVLSWRSVSSGSDCFIRGLPRFSIPKTHATIIEWHSMQVARRLGSNATRRRDSELERVHPLSWVVLPIDLQVFGHFPSAMQSTNAMQSRRYLCDVLSAPDTNPARQNLIRFQTWWNDASNSNALDELAGLKGEAAGVFGLTSVRGIGDVYEAALLTHGAADDLLALSR